MQVCLGVMKATSELQGMQITCVASLLMQHIPTNMNYPYYTKPTMIEILCFSIDFVITLYVCLCKITFLCYV